VYWRKYDNSEENHHTQTLEFNPVTRANSGTYICQADNQIGKSNEEPVEINVECKTISILNMPKVNDLGKSGTV
jgi:hypothetical protein